MKIAIHHRPNSYSEHWIEYCQQHNIQYKIVDAFANDFFRQVSDCDAFMWHFHQEDHKATLFAKQLICTLCNSGKIVYPDFNTCWHFDDKVGQKYLFESLDIPYIPTYIFYTRNEAFSWAKQTSYPKVFKLRTGASSSNVRLVKNYRRAINIINKSFCFGFEQYDRLNGFKERWRLFVDGKGSFFWLFKGFVRLFISTKFSRIHQREKGYVYFQDFIPNNKFDIRILLIGNRAIAEKRVNRENDFRASGSQINIFDPKQIETKYIQAAFEINKKLKMQSAAFDFLSDQFNNPIITEVSYGCGIKPNINIPGYWSCDLQWHECHNTNYCYWIIEDIITKINFKTNCQLWKQNIS